MSTAPTAAEPTAADLFVPADVRGRIYRSVAPNTRKAYERAWRDFGEWCGEHGRMAFPVTPQTLATYVSHLAGLHRSPSSLSQAIACIRRMHGEAGHKGHPGTEMAKDVLRDYRREWAGNGGRVRRAAPIVVDALRRMIATLDLTRAAGLRNRAIRTLGLVIMGRRGELSALDISDLVLTPDGYDVLFRMSKTDQDAEGEIVLAPFGEHPQTCPVLSVKAWLEALAAQGITDGALFRSVDKADRIAGGTGRPYAVPRLTGKSINEIIHELSLTADIDTTAHGIRVAEPRQRMKPGSPSPLSAAKAGGAPPPSSATSGPSTA